MTKQSKESFTVRKLENKVALLLPERTEVCIVTGIVTIPIVFLGYIQKTRFNVKYWRKANIVKEESSIKEARDFLEKMDNSISWQYRERIHGLRPKKQKSK